MHDKSIKYKTFFRLTTFTFDERHVTQLLPLSHVYKFKTLVHIKSVQSCFLWSVYDLRLFDKFLCKVKLEL